jgi:putative two-component system response regulator
MVECRDDVTGGHIDRTQQYLRILTDTLIERDLYPEYRDLLKDKFFLQSAQLHDVGKIAIQDSILKKPAKLTIDEYEKMKTHTSFGVKIIEKIGENTSEKTFLEHAKIFAGTHHEKWDGSGYPAGIKGRDIPLHGRLMAIADVYDALISERPYKKPFSHQEAVDIIVSGRGTHFDPEITDIFLSVAHLFNDAATCINEVNNEEKQVAGI